MRDPTEQQAATYREAGYTVVEGFLDAAELALWRGTTDEAIAERLASGGESNQSDADAYYAQVFTQCERLADTHSGMARLILDEHLGQAAATLADVDGIRIWHDQALVKPPYGNPTGWHLDVPFWSFDSPDAISIWIALDDATVENGCLWYLPGTHREARYELTPIGENLGALFREYPGWIELEPVPAACRAGDAIFHNGLVAHGAGANMTPRPRRAMTCAFMPDGATYNGRPHSMLPAAYFASLAVGDPLGDDRLLPLVWRR